MIHDQSVADDAAIATHKVLGAGSGWASLVGDTFYVHSGRGSDSTAYGRTPANPFDTIAFAISQCAADHGDVIIVCPGHAETIAAAGGITVNKAGVAIRGIGRRAERPTLTFSAAASTLKTTVANAYVGGLRLVSDVDSLLSFLDLDEGGFVCEDCDLVTSNTKEAICFADIATLKDDFTFRRCRFYQPTDPAGGDGDAGTGCFYFVESKELFFEDCYFHGNFETAIWHNKTTAATNVWIRGCHGTQLLDGAEVFTQVAGMSGGIFDSLIVNRNAEDVTEAVVTGTLAANFFVHKGTAAFGNDGAGGQAALPIAADAS